MSSPSFKKRTIQVLKPLKNLEDHQISVHDNFSQCNVDTQCEAILVNLDKKSDLAYVEINIHNKAYIALIDGGASRSLVSKDIVKDMTRCSLKAPPLRTVAGDPITTFGIVEVPIVIANIHLLIQCIVVNSLPCDLLIGKDSMKAHDILDLNFEISVKGVTVPLTTRHHNNFISTVSTTTSFTLKKNSVHTVLCASAKKLKNDHCYLVQGHFPQGVKSDSITCVPLLQKPLSNNFLCLELTNFSQSDIHFQANEPLGYASSVSSNDISDNLDTINSILEETISNPNTLPSQMTSHHDIISSLASCGAKSPLIQDQIRTLFNTHKSIFSKDKWDIQTPANVPPYNVRLKPNAVPKFLKPYKIPEANMAKFKEILDTLEKNGVIEAGISEWGSPAMIIQKKEANEFRFLIDLRYANSNVIITKSNLPNIEYLLTTQINHKNSKLFSTIDLSQCFFQFPINDPNKVLSLSTVFGSYVFKRLPQGFASSTGVVQSVVNTLLRGLIGTNVICLLDDILIHTEDNEELHFTILQEVICRLSKANLRIKPNKCHIMVPTTNFCGIKIDAKGIHVQESKVAKAQNWPTPKTLKDLRSFVAFCSFVRRHIPNFTRISLPLLNLMKTSDKNLEWSSQHDKAFKLLKYAVTSAPVLKPPDPSKKFYVYTDASTTALGFAVCQLHKPLDGGKECLAPVTYGSRVVSKTESKYHIAELEGLCVAFALTKCRHMLLNKDFIVRTDSSAVKHAFTKGSEGVSKRVARFGLLIQDILPQGGKLIIEHVNSHLNFADPFSRVNFPSFKEDHMNNDYDGFLISAITTRSMMKADGLLHEIILAQASDPEIQKMTKIALKKKELFAHKKKYIISDGALAVSTSKGTKFVIPKGLAKSIILKLHYHPMESHPSASKMQIKLSEKYHIAGLTDLTQAVAKSCDSCQRSLLSNFHAKAEMGHIPRASVPGEIYCIDVAGPYLNYNTNLKYIVFVIDTFSRYLWTKCVKEQSGEEIANFLMDIYGKAGVPKVLLSDRATSLRHGVVPILNAKLGVKKVETTSYHPAGNGMCERVIGTICRKIKTIVEEVSDKSKWPEAAARATDAYNRQVHVATGFAPAQIALGYIPSIGFTPLEPKFPGLKTHSQFVHDKLDFMKQVYEQVNSNLNEYAEKLKASFDKHAKPHSFQPGQWVLVKKGAVKDKPQGKLTVPYIGPAEIESIDNHKAHIIFIANGVTQTVNIERLKNYYQDKDTMLEVNKFTAPKRQEGTKKSEHADIISDLQTDEEELQQGITGKSPFKNNLVTKNDDTSTVQHVSFKN